MQRGHVMALMIVILAAISASVATFSGRLTVDLNSRRASEVRSQSLWLARSALTTGQRGRHVIETPKGQAVVLVEGKTATVTLAGATATVTAQPWEERFTPALPPK